MTDAKRFPVYCCVLMVVGSAGVGNALPPEDVPSRTRTELSQANPVVSAAEWDVSAGSAEASLLEGSGGDCTLQAFTGADVCSSATVVPLAVPPDGSPVSVTISGDNSTATAGDCSDLGATWWEAFSIDQPATVRIDFCCTVPVFSPVFTVIKSSCPSAGASCSPFIGSDDWGLGAPVCPEGNFWMTFGGLAAGTYYFPVPSAKVGAQGPYQIHITAGAASGACCNPADGTCSEDVLSIDCAGAQEQFFPGSTCCEAECSDTPGQFDASGVTLLSQVGFGEFPGSPHLANEIWSYVSPGGEEYAIIGFSTGTGFVRVTDPTKPVVVGFIDGAGVDQVWRDMAVFGESAYVVTDGAGVGLQIVDLTDIDNDILSLANTTDLGVGFVDAHNVFVNPDSGFLYMALPNTDGGNGLSVFDLKADPTNPTLSGVWIDSDPGVRCHDVQVISYTEGPNAGREIAFCFAENDGLRVVDVTDKSNMVRLSKLSYPNATYTHQGWVSEDRRHVLIGDELDELNNPNVTQTQTYIVNIQDLSNPFLVTSFGNGLCSIDHNLMVRGQFVYEANYSTGLRIFNICDVDAVREIGFFDTRPEDNAVNFMGAWGVDTRLPSGIVLVSDRQRGLFVLDVSEALASVDGDGDGFPDDCVVIPDPQPPTAAAPPHVIRKNRFISFGLDTASESVAIRVELLDQACAISGRTCTVDHDCRVCVGGDNAGLSCSIESECLGGGTCTVSGEICAEQSPPVMLGWVSDPFTPSPASQAPPGIVVTRVRKKMPELRAWSEPVVHIGDCEIAPVQSYALSTTTDGAAFSERFRVGTAKQPFGKSWADLVGTVANGVFTPPNGILSVNDLAALLAFFQGKTTSDPELVVTVLELTPEVPSLVISASDLGEWLRAFAGGQYPPPSFPTRGGPADCP